MIRILKNRSSDDLEKEINHYITRGWNLRGDLIVMLSKNKNILGKDTHYCDVYLGSQPDEFLYIQVVEKNEEIKKGY